MKVKIDKLSSNRNTYKTPLPFEGELIAKPEIGQCVYVTGGDYGGIVTSNVIELMEIEGGWKVQTRNSMYEIIVLGE